MAPQILNKEGYNYKVDIWALGVIFYELIVGSPPFKAKTLKELKHNIFEGQYEFPSDCIPS
jgi:serine/threonine protein kinase